MADMLLHASTPTTIPRIPRPIHVLFNVASGECGARIEENPTGVLALRARIEWGFGGGNGDRECLVFDKTGWNNYSTINLKFNDQVVCTKIK
jgi:hypothetical protein